MAKKKPIKHQQLSIPQLAQLIKGCLGLMLLHACLELDGGVRPSCRPKGLLVVSRVDLEPVWLDWIALDWIGLEWFGYWNLGRNADPLGGSVMELGYGLQGVLYSNYTSISQISLPIFAALTEYTFHWGNHLICISWVSLLRAIKWNRSHKLCSI